MIRATITIDRKTAEYAAAWLGRMIADGGHKQCVAPNNCERTLERLEEALARPRGDDPLSALGIALGLITKHGLAVELAKNHPEDFERLQAARAVAESRP